MMVHVEEVRAPQVRVTFRLACVDGGRIDHRLDGRARGILFLQRHASCGEPEATVHVRDREVAHREHDLRRRGIELPCRGANVRAERGRRKRNAEERATRSSGAHSSQLN